MYCITEWIQTALVPDEYVHTCLPLMMPAYQRVERAVTGRNYETADAHFALPYDDKMIARIHEYANYYRQQKPALLVCLGIGGSHAGMYAVYQALIASGVLRTTEPTIPVHFIESLDPFQLQKSLDLMRQVAGAGGKILLIIITKSGTTTETLINAQLFITLMRTYFPDSYHTWCVCITDEGSPLESAAYQLGIRVLTIPPVVGGRYSIFSAAGLFPLACMGIAIDELCRGARAVYPSLIDPSLLHNPAAFNALALVYHYARGYVVHDTFVWSPVLDGLGRWYRQLLAESLGKHQTDNVQEVSGLLPTVTIGTTDLHSMYQLYLGGPRRTYTSFVAVRMHESAELNISSVSELQYGAGAGYAGMTVPQVLDAIMQGVMVTYQRHALPYVTYQFQALSAYELGKFMTIKMAEVVYVGHMWHVNPYDQPHVELYKKETRALLQKRMSQ